MKTLVNTRTLTAIGFLCLAMASLSGCTSPVLKSSQASASSALSITIPVDPALFTPAAAGSSGRFLLPEFTGQDLFISISKASDPAVILFASKAKIVLSADSKSVTATLNTPEFPLGDYLVVADIKKPNSETIISQARSLVSLKVPGVSSSKKMFLLPTKDFPGLATLTLGVQTTAPLTIADNESQIISLPLDATFANAPLKLTWSGITTETVDVFLRSPSGEILTPDSLLDSGRQGLTFKPTESGNYFVIIRNPKAKNTAPVSVAGVLLPVALLYDGNGCDDSAQIPASVPGKSAGDQVPTTVPGAMTKSGKVFYAWNTAADGTGKEYLIGDKVTLANQNTILFAIWHNPITVQLTNPTDKPLTLTGTQVTLNRKISQSMTVNAPAGDYTTFKWSLSGDTTAPPLISGNNTAQLTLTTAPDTSLSLYTVTLFYGTGELQFSQSFNIQVTEE